MANPLHVRIIALMSSFPLSFQGAKKEESSSCFDKLSSL